MNNKISNISLLNNRWNNYHIVNGNNFSNFWKDYLSCKGRHLLFIIGLGFDPRMCLGYETILKFGGEGRRDCMTIKINEGLQSPSREFINQSKKNEEKIKRLLKSNSLIIEKEIKMTVEDGSRRIGSSMALNIIKDLSEISFYDDIIIDISALPRNIYFPLIGKILKLVDHNKKEDIKCNIHIIVAENINIDTQIFEEGIAEEANYIKGFIGDLESTAHEDHPKIWIPILGENQNQQLQRMARKIKADEIFPLIPSPSRLPRRGMNLILEYQELLFDTLIVYPKNYLYGAESNPFEVYRQLYRTILNYKEAFDTLAESKIIISASSSKLLSLGALLVAYELKDLGIGIMSVETLGYDMNTNIEQDLSETELYSLWIAGDCYAS